MESQDLLLDSGSKFNILSVDLLNEIEKSQQKKIPMRAPTVKLVSHTGNSLDVLGEVKISLKLKSENEENYLFHQVYFQITNDTNRSLLGTDFITPRRAVVQYSYKDNIELACVQFPINVIVKEIQYAQELENFHFNNKTSFTLSPVWATTILPGERQVVRCKIRGIPKDLSKKLRGKTIIATLDQDLFSMKSHTHHLES